MKDMVKKLLKLSTKKAIGGTLKQDHEETPLARKRSETLLVSMITPSLSTTSLSSLGGKLPFDYMDEMMATTPTPTSSTTTGMRGGGDPFSQIFDQANDAILLL